MKRKTFRKIQDFLTLNFWKKIKDEKVPKWVKSKIKFFYKHCNYHPYNRIFYFRGRNNIYRV